MSRPLSGKYRIAAALCVMVAASATAAAQEAGKDLIGRPVDLDTTRGVQAPPRDASKLPKTFAEAAKTQPVDPKWGTTAYKPKSRRDFNGIWINQGGIGWTPGVPPGAKQNPPLTPEYQKIFQQHLANAAAGHPTGDSTSASCLPPGMPRRRRCGRSCRGGAEVLLVLRQTEG